MYFTRCSWRQGLTSITLLVARTDLKVMYDKSGGFCQSIADFLFPCMHSPQHAPHSLYNIYMQSWPHAASWVGFHLTHGKLRGDKFRGGTTCVTGASPCEGGEGEQIGGRGESRGKNRSKESWSLQRSNGRKRLHESRRGSCEKATRKKQKRQTYIERPQAPNKVF